MLYKGVKYACGTCIKGHRSSQCTHAERPLFEIRKKGRPVTQCSLCRDLRKTKQVHIKCACTHKSKDKASIVVPDTRDTCNCSDSNHDHHLPTTAAQDDSAGYVNMTASDEAYLSLLSSSSTIQQPSMIDWALTSATEETPLFANDDNADLGFLFHKPSSRRFLDGQPRPPRKKSGKKQQAATLSYQQQQPSTLASSSTAMMPTSTVENTSQKHIMLPFMNMDLSSSTSSTTSSSSSSCADGDPLSTDVTTMLNNVLMQQAEDQDLAETIYNDRDFTGWMDTTSYTLSHPPQQPSAPASDYCSMYPGQTECRSKHNATRPGESVLITITPLPSITSSTVQAKVRTRLATCYCPSHCCTCPGCLVHPFAGLTEHVGSTTTSSVYSNSDDEDHHPPMILLG